MEQQGSGPLASTSPVSVITGFSCSLLPSPRASSSAANSNSSNSNLRSSPARSLLSQLLSQATQPCDAADGAYDDYDEDDCSTYDDDEHQEDDHNLFGLQGQAPAGCLQPRFEPLTRSRSGPVTIPSTLYLKDANAITELRQLHVARYQRRVQEEERERQEAAHQMCAQQQHQLQAHHHHYHHHQQQQHHHQLQRAATMGPTTCAAAAAPA